MVINQQRGIAVSIRPLAGFLRRAQRSLHLADREVTVCLVTDAAIARMNRKFRGQRGPTDVLSFPLSNGNSRHARYLGDIAISAQTARRNARREGRSLSEELRVLILHGVLHLAGYDHETDNGEMERLERQLRVRMGLG
jgi:probable rRNA maturation factor